MLEKKHWFSFHDLLQQHFRFFMIFRSIFIVDIIIISPIGRLPATPLIAFVPLRACICETLWLLLLLLLLAVKRILNKQPHFCDFNIATHISYIAGKRTESGFI